MASTITITCPECDKQLKASSEVLGKKIRCKGCGATFSARAAAGDAAPPKKPSKKDKEEKAKGGGKSAEKAKKPSDEGEDENPYGVTEEYLGRRCPDCANAMDEEDVICLHCGYNTTTRQKARTRKVVDITGGDVFMWLLPGILCAIGAITVITLDALYVFMVGEGTVVDPDSWIPDPGKIQPKIYATLIALFIAYKLGYFAVMRLIVHNKPPEVEIKGAKE